MGKFEAFCDKFTDMWDQIMGFAFVIVLAGILVKLQSCVLLLIHFPSMQHNIINAWLPQKTIYTLKKSSLNLKDL